MGLGVVDVMGAFEDWSSGRSSARGPALLGGLLAALLLAGLLAVLLHSSDEPRSGSSRSRNGTQGSAAAAGTPTSIAGGAAGGAGVDVFTLQTGSCYDEIASDLGTVNAKPCSQAHDGEIYHRFPVASGADRTARFPGEAKIEAESDASCAKHFAEFVGIAVDKSSFALLYWFPDETDWSSGLRDVLCVVVGGREGEKLPASARGARR